MGGVSQRVVLDTSVLVGGMDLGRDGWEAAVTAVTYAELEYGVSIPALEPAERAIRQQRLNQIRTLFGPGLPFDDSAASSYGLITRFVLESGRQVRGCVPDLMIAAIAHAHGAALATNDKADLVPLEPLVRIITPTIPATANPESSVTEPADPT